MPNLPYPSVQISIVVLAAGKGTRFNGHKMMHPIHGIPMAIKSTLNASNALEHSLTDVLMVVQPNDHRLKSEAKKIGIKTLDNPDFEQGMSTSIVRAVKTLPSSNHILLCLGDMPFIHSSTYQQLIQTFKDNQATRIVRPRLRLYNQPLQMGHPVLFPRELKDSLLALTGDTGAKAILKQHAPILIDTIDQGVIKDVDTH